MRRLWECDDWSRYLDLSCRHGLRLRFDAGVDPEVHRACLEFGAWLRREYEFPMRVPIYFKNKKYLISATGERASATFWGAFDKTLEPHIRIAVDDYEDILESFGKDNALAAILGSMAHELSHYFQWIKDFDIMDAKMERQAKYYSDVIVWDYAETREHP